MTTLSPATLKTGRAHYEKQQQAGATGRKVRERTKRKQTRYQQEQKIVVNETRLGGTLEEAAAVIGISGNALKLWMNKDKAFQARVQEARVVAVEYAEGRADGSLPEAIDGLIALGKSPDENIKLKSFLARLHGRGVFTRNQEVSVKGMVGIFNADDMAREFREAKKRMAEAGSRLLGLDGGDGQDK
ncbi:hypothetical protein LCGC14_0498540 [marine sediment metagenome]|uniref:Homeodomain phBC6A51-type domain-containing protein n=1 Tax=marine sediment metagenome TaxID=412755 RepID=A0A0F9S4H2_9ZZZZ